MKDRQHTPADTRVTISRGLFSYNKKVAEGDDPK